MPLAESCVFAVAPSVARRAVNGVVRAQAQSSVHAKQSLPRRDLGAGGRRKGEREDAEMGGRLETRYLGSWRGGMVAMVMGCRRSAA